MSEHLRRQDHTGRVWQWCDTKRYVIFDQHTGMLGIPGIGFLLTKKQALDHIQSPGWEDRRHIVKLDCISAFIVSENALEGSAK